MKKIIHMSDLHVGYEGLGERFRQVVENLVTQKGGHPQDYVIVITGDLVDNAHYPESYAIVKSGLDVLRRAGFEDILVIPGNHDYGTGSRGNKKFIQIFQETIYGDHKSYPRKDIIGDIAFLGLDSMAEELNWHDYLWAQGELGKKQLLRLSAALEAEDVRRCKKRVIYLHHHPFDARPLHQLKDSRKLKKTLMAAIAQGITIDALLYGHNHEGKSHNGHWGIPRCYDAGSATLKPRPKRVEKWKLFPVNASVREISLDDADPAADRKLVLFEG